MVDTYTNSSSSIQANSNSLQLLEYNQPEKKHVDRKTQYKDKRAITSRQNGRDMSYWSISSTPQAQPNHVNQVRSSPTAVVSREEEYENNLKAMAKQLYDEFDKFFTVEALDSLILGYATTIEDNQPFQQAGETRLDKDEAQIDKELIKYLDKSGASDAETKAKLERKFSYNISIPLSLDHIINCSLLVTRIKIFFEIAIERVEKLENDTETVQNTMKTLFNLKKTNMLFCIPRTRKFLKEQEYSKELNEITELQVKLIEKYLILWNSQEKYKALFSFNILYLIYYILEYKPESDIIFSNISFMLPHCLEQITKEGINERNLLGLPHLLLCLIRVIKYDSKNASLALPIISKVIDKISGKYYILSMLKNHEASRLIEALKYFVNMSDELLTYECEKLILKLRLELRLELNSR